MARRQKNEKELEDACVVANFYDLVITPGVGGIHELIFRESPHSRSLKKIENHTVKSLIERIRELDLDTLRVRQEKIDRRRQHTKWLKSTPEKYL